MCEKKDKSGFRISCLSDDPVCPDLAWYTKISSTKKLPSRCPYANPWLCDHYYGSQLVLSKANYLPFDKGMVKRVEKHWKDKKLYPVADVDGPSLHTSCTPGLMIFSNFCPEISYKCYGLFASSLAPHCKMDEYDRIHVEQMLKRLKLESDDWRRNWDNITPLHFSDCPSFSILSACRKDDKIDLHPPNPLITRTTPSVPKYTCKKCVDNWTMRFNGPFFFLRNTKGVQWLALLLRHPDEEFSAIELKRKVEGFKELATSSEDDLRDVKDDNQNDNSLAAGLNLRSHVPDSELKTDRKTIQACLNRKTELEEELAEAQKNQDHVRAGNLAEEIEKINEYFAKNTVCKNRARSISLSLESARVSVTKAINSTIKKIKDNDKIFGLYLEKTITTGGNLIYHPSTSPLPGNKTIRWNT